MNRRVSSAIFYPLRSKYQLTTAKLPLAKDLDDFDFTSNPYSVRSVVTGENLRDSSHEDSRRRAEKLSP
jgi:hypothetical protein